MNKDLGSYAVDSENSRLSQGSKYFISADMKESEFYFNNIIKFEQYSFDISSIYKYNNII